MTHVAHSGAAVGVGCVGGEAEEDVHDRDHDRVTSSHDLECCGVGGCGGEGRQEAWRR